MQPSRVILNLSDRQAWFLYYLLWAIPGGTAKQLRASLGDLLEKMRKGGTNGTRR